MLKSLRSSQDGFGMVEALAASAVLGLLVLIALFFFNRSISPKLSFKQNQANAATSLSRVSNASATTSSGKVVITVTMKDTHKPLANTGVQLEYGTSTPCTPSSDPKQPTVCSNVVAQHDWEGVTDADGKFTVTVDKLSKSDNTQLSKKRPAPQQGYEVIAIFDTHGNSTRSQDTATVQLQRL